MWRRRFTGLWRNRDFLKLWTGQTVSVFGSWIGASAMTFTAILVLHATPFQLGLLSVARLLPGFLTGLAAGAWVDRLRRRPILIGADLGRAALLATIPAAAAARLLHIEQLYAVTFFVSVLTIFFDVAYQSYLPSLIGREALVEGNSKLSASAAAAETGGFAAAGWLVQLFTAPITILIDAVSFVVSAFSVRLIRAPEREPAREPGPGMHHEIAEGIRVVLQDRLLRSLALCTLTKEFFAGIYGALVVLYMVRGLGFAPGILGTFWAVGGVSSLIGAAVATRANRRFGMGPATISALSLYCAAMFLIPFARGAAFAAALLLILQQIVGDGPAAIYQINQLSLRQAVAPERLLGRVNASAEFLSLGAMLAGSLLGGVLGEAIGVRATLFLGAGGSLISPLVLALSPVLETRFGFPRAPRA
jgi:Na+/melibiose symporter-like transporter